MVSELGGQIPSVIAHLSFLVYKYHLSLVFEWYFRKGKLASSITTMMSPGVGLHLVPLQVVTHSIYLIDLFLTETAPKTVRWGGGGWDVETPVTPSHSFTRSFNSRVQLLKLSLFLVV